VYGGTQKWDLSLSAHSSSVPLNTPKKMPSFKYERFSEGQTPLFSCDSSKSREVSRKDPHKDSFLFPKMALSVIKRIIRVSKILNNFFKVGRTKMTAKDAKT
jgi:hypothetical protein